MSADDLIAEARRLLLPFENGQRQYDEAAVRDSLDRHQFTDDFVALASAAPRLLAALVERVSRQPQEEIIAELLRLLDCPRQHPHAGLCHDTIGPLHVSWKHGDRAASVSHQPVDAPIAPVVVNSQQEPPKERTRLMVEKAQAALNCLDDLRACRWPPAVNPERWIQDTKAPLQAIIDLLDSAAEGQQEPPQEPALRQALKEIRYICRDVELGNWFAPDAIEHIIVACESVDDQPATDARQQDQEQADRQAPDPAPAPAPPSPIACPILQSQVAYAIDAAITEHAAQALHRDPCGCVHDGTAIVHWCRRSAPVDRAQDPQD